MASKNRYFYKLLSWAALSLIALTAASCSEPASPFGQTEITLTALDASCTEVWLKLKFSNLTQPADVQIQKDGKDYPIYDVTNQQFYNKCIIEP